MERKRPRADSPVEEQSASKKSKCDISDPAECYPKKEQISLTVEQQAVVDAALGGRNIFLTGAAGCGKTVTVKQLIATLKDKAIKFQVAAPTGIAALPLGGKTTSSFMGWIPDSLATPIKDLMENVSKAARA